MSLHTLQVSDCLSGSTDSSGTLCGGKDDGLGGRSHKASATQVPLGSVPAVQVMQTLHRHPGITSSPALDTTVGPVHRAL